MLTLKRSMTIATLGLGLGLGWLAPEARAAAQGAVRATNTVRTGSLRPPTYRLMLALEELLAHAQWQQGLQRLDAFAVRTKGYEYEQLMLDRIRIQFLLGSENFSRALPVLERTLDSPYVAAPARQDYLHNLAQIYATLNQWAPVIRVLNRWMQAEPEPEAAVVALLGFAYYRQGNPARAAALLRDAIARQSREHPNEPQLDWYKLLLAASRDRGNLAGAAAVLRSLVAHFPEQSAMFLELAHTAQQQGDPQLALAGLRWGQAAGADSSEVVREQILLLVQMKDPQRAAQLGERAVKAGWWGEQAGDWDLLIDAWLQARAPKQALQTAERAARTASANPGHFQYRIGELLLTESRWAEAATRLSEALNLLDAAAKNSSPQADSHSEKESAHAALLQGIALLYQGKFTSSRRSLQRASRHPDQRREANRWLQHLP